MTAHRTLRALTRVLILASLGTMTATSLFAQQTRPVNSERISVAGGLDVRNAYMFRGVRQDDTGTITWPSAAVGLRLHAAERGLTSARVRVGTFNSLHSGWAGSGGPSGKPWYESDVYTTLSLGFSNALALDTTYTAYHSPNKMFTNVKEVSFKVSADRPALRGVSLRPYALTAFELNTSPGIGQLDGGFKAGRYLELGATPSHQLHRIGLSVPVKVGLSLGNYYELAGTDHRFGFASVGGIATLPITRTFSVHGGIEYQHLGTTTKTFNGGDASRVIASAGIGFTY